MREHLTQDRTYYVRTDGSNSNDGLSNTSTGAFATIKYAGDFIASNIDLGAFNVTVKVAPGSYAGIQMLRPFIGNEWVTFEGDVSNPSSVQVSGFNATMNASYKIKGFKISDASLECALYASAGALIRVVGPMEFGVMSSNGSGCHVRANFGGYITLESGYTISTGAAVHLWSSLGGKIEYSTGGGGTVTLVNTPHFPAAFAFSIDNGIIYASGVTYSGSATGPRYAAQFLGNIQTHSAGANFFPGNSAGSTMGGGIYN